MCLVTCENHTVSQTVWKDIVEADMSQKTIWRMRIACWIRKATNIDSEYVLLIAFQLQQWLREHASTLRYTHTACHV